MYTVLYYELAAAVGRSVQAGPEMLAVRRALPLTTRRALRNLCDDARAAAMQAIANAKRSAGELEAAEAAAAAADHNKMGSKATAADKGSLLDLHGNSMVGIPRFPIGAPVKCRLGEHKWSMGQVIGHLYKEKAWPDNRRAPYQVKIEDGPTIFAPADIDECIQSGLRFKVGSVVEAYLGEDHGWALGVVVRLFHHEPSWEPGRWVPYQIKLEGVGGAGDTLIWAPEDNDACVRGLLEWPRPSSGSAAADGDHSAVPDR